MQVHSVLQIRLEAAQVVTAYEEPRTPKSIYELLRQKSWKDWQAERLPDEEATTEEDLPEKVRETTKNSFHEQLDGNLKRKDGTFEWLLRKRGFH